MSIKFKPNCNTVTSSFDKISFEKLMMAEFLCCGLGRWFSLVDVADMFERLDAIDRKKAKCAVLPMGDKFRILKHGLSH